jgi:hypothetical protein
MIMTWLLDVASTSLAITVHAVAAPIVFALVAWRYFSARGARDALPTAWFFTLLVALLDLGLAAFVLENFTMFASLTGTWLPLSLIFAVTWLTGFVRSTMPWPKPRPSTPASAGAP